MENNITLGKYKEKVDILIEEYIKDKIKTFSRWDEDIEKVIEQFMKIARGGKRIRAYLMYLGYKIAGGEEEQKIIKASVFVELFHAGLLVQDDVMDRARKRRGVKTVHTVFSDLHRGEAMATLVGDLTFSWAMEILLNSGFGDDVVREVQGEFSRQFETVVLGQMKDLANTYSDEFLEKDDIEKVMRYKTAEYTGAMPLLVGAKLAGCKNEEILENLALYGRSLGWAFQVRDDYLWVDTVGEDKDVGSDVKEKKQTLLSWYFFKHASEELQKEFAGIWGRDVGEKELERARELMKESGAYEFVKEEAEKYVDKGKKAILELTSNEGERQILEGILEFVVNRGK